MFSNPEQNVAQLDLRDGMRVADFGAGTGFYSRAASKRVGNSGKVYAIEIQKDFVKKLEDDLKNWHISNVECIWGDIESLGGTKLADSSMDLIIISNILFQVEDKFGLIDEVKRVLKPNGQVLLVDWSDSFSGMGPDINNIIKKDKAIELFNKRGLKFLKDIIVGDHHYGIILIHE